MLLAIIVAARYLYYTTTYHGERETERQTERERGTERGRERERREREEERETVDKGQG